MHKLLCLLILTLLVQAPPIQANLGGSWQDHASLDIPRQEVGAARIGGKVYVVGGLLAGFPLVATNTVEAYDIAMNQWNFVAPLPVGLDHMGAAAFNGKLYVAGGYSADFVPRNGLHIYDPGTDGWSVGSPLPQIRGAGWMVEHSGKLYYFGGSDLLGATNSTYIYDPSGNSWTVGSNMPTAREHLTAVSAGDYIYVIGGRSGASNNLNERYDPVNDQWATMAPMPTARSATGTAFFVEKIHVMGGETPGLHAVHEVYDIAQDTWDCRAPMPLPRHGIAAVTLDDRIFVPAGGIIAGFGPTSAADSFMEDVTAVGTYPAESSLRLLPNVPNPFIQCTDIRYVLSQPGRVSVLIYSSSGRVVRSLLSGVSQPPGLQKVRWDGTDASGRVLPSGVYFYRLRVDGMVRSGQMLLAR